MCSHLDDVSLPERFDSPDLFVSVLCNPKWQEISDALPLNSRWRHHAAIGKFVLCEFCCLLMLHVVTKDFYEKLHAMLGVIVQSGMFGDVQALAYRSDRHPSGLPRAVVLILLQSKVSVNRIDTVISAEIPCVAKQPELHDFVCQWMVHAPCDHIPHARCRVGRCKRTCSHGYPQPWVPKTLTVDDHYAYYRRRGLFSFDRNGVTISDHWVLPYNPLFLLMFQCQLKVELSAPRAGEFWHRSELSLLS
jgi:hypothetical protein